MNKVIAVAILTFIFSGPIIAQWEHEDIPAQVSTSFKITYPDIDQKGIDWDWEDDGYEANFTLDGQDHKAFFSHDGMYISSEIKDISQKDLPDDVMNSIQNRKINNSDIQKINQLVTDENAYYEIEIDNKKKDYKMYFNKNGMEINKDVYKKNKF